MTKQHERVNSDPANGIFSNSCIESFLTCPRLYYYRYVAKLQNLHSLGDIEFGNLFHQIVAEFYSSKDIDKLNQLALSGWEQGNIPAHPKKNLATLLAAIPLYAKTYAHLEFEEEFIEVPYRIPMPNGTEYIGVLDRLQKTSVSVTPEDTKTTGTSLSSPMFWSNYINSGQLIGYYYVAQQLFENVDGVIVDAVQFPCKDERNLERRPLTITSLQVDEWVNTYTQITNTLRKLAQGNAPLSAYYQNFSSCSKYMGCKFVELCRLGTAVVQPEIVSAESDE